MSISIPQKCGILFLFLFLLGFVSQSAAQVSIAPTSLFFNEQNHFSSLAISNGGQEAQEISITTEFGYPASQNGQLYIATDSILADTKSIADQVKIFPKNFTLQPDQRQTVRFVLRPEQGLKPGGYWSRVRISSNPVSPPVDSVEQGQVGAQINLVVNQVIAAHYRTQNAQTDVQVNNISFTQNDSTNTGTIAIGMEQTGNAPFIGSIKFTVTNGSGESVYQTATTNAVYTTITRSFAMDLTGIDPGTYMINGTIESNRRDISSNNLLQINPVSFQKEITIE